MCISLLLKNDLLSLLKYYPQCKEILQKLESLPKKLLYG